MKVNVAGGELGEARVPDWPSEVSSTQTWVVLTVSNKQQPNLEEVHLVAFRQVIQRYLMVVLQGYNVEWSQWKQLPAGSSWFSSSVFSVDWLVPDVRDLSCTNVDSGRHKREPQTIGSNFSNLLQAVRTGVQAAQMSGIT